MKKEYHYVTIQIRRKNYRIQTSDLRRVFKVPKHALPSIPNYDHNEINSFLDSEDIVHLSELRSYEIE